MKKLLTILILVILALSGTSFGMDAAVNVNLNGTELQFDVNPTIINGRTMLPVKVIFEALGLNVEWDPNTRTVSGHKDDVFITLKIDDKIAIVNGKNVILDSPATVINNRTLVPLKFIAESTGASVTWDGTSRTVLIEEKNESKSEEYTLIAVYGGDLSGYRQANVKVDIGYGSREYWAYTNSFGQLIKITANEIILQNDNTEPVLSTGRYYSDEAKVPGTENPTLDEGHVIADSLGGVSNAYNITPQDSSLNRFGDQAYMEYTIRKAIESGMKVTDFEAIITYPNTLTQIPSHYMFTYKIDGREVIDEFDNINPEVANSSSYISTYIDPDTGLTELDINFIDTNRNGIVTIEEAKAAGFKMPIYSTHWLYKYMIDRDGDGQVGEEDESSNASLGVINLPAGTLGARNVSISYKVISNNHVGNEWGAGFKFNDTYFWDDDILSFSATSGIIVINAFAYEYDEAKSDYGFMDFNIDLSQPNIYTGTVTVVENGGQFSGNRAVVELTIIVY